MRSYPPTPPISLKLLPILSADSPLAFVLADTRTRKSFSPDPIPNIIQMHTVKCTPLDQCVDVHTRDHTCMHLSHPSHACLWLAAYRRLWANLPVSEWSELGWIHSLRIEIWLAQLIAVWYSLAISSYSQSFPNTSISKRCTITKCIWVTHCELNHSLFKFCTCFEFIHFRC